MHVDDEAEVDGALDAEPPLAGVRVVDMTTSYAGPTATMYLADLGADVIKVERPAYGDDARSWGPPFVGEAGMSAWFASANRNKRSIALDLRSSGGREVLDRLLAGANVFAENLNPAKLQDLALAPSVVRRRHPHLIYCAISGFGLTGPDAGRPGYDLVAQARSGMMSVTGEAGGSPQRVSTALSDVVAGMVAALAVTAAIRRQDRTGQGELVDVSLLDADLALMAPRIASFLAGEPEPRPSGGTDSVLAVYQRFETADRPIVVAIGNDVIWRRFCASTGLFDRGEDQRLSTNEGRRRHRAEVVAAIRRLLATDTAENWLSVLGAAGVPASPVQTLSEVAADPQVTARGTLVPVAVPGGQAWTVRTPWRYGSPRRASERAASADRAAFAERTASPDRPPPALGGDALDVLREHDFSAEDIDRLLRSGAVQHNGRGPARREGDRRRDEDRGRHASRGEAR